MAAALFEDHQGTQTALMTQREKFVDEISPQSGRHIVAHGASRGSDRSSPLSRPGGRGGRNIGVKIRRGHPNESKQPLSSGERGDRKAEGAPRFAGRGGEGSFGTHGHPGGSETVQSVDVEARTTHHNARSDPSPALLRRAPSPQGRGEGFFVPPALCPPTKRPYFNAYEGGRRGGEGPIPMAYAMGYITSPLTGLRKFRFHHSDSCKGLLTQGTSLVRERFGN